MSSQHVRISTKGALTEELKTEQPSGKERNSSCSDAILPILVLFYLKHLFSCLQPKDAKAHLSPADGWSRERNRKCLCTAHKQKSLNLLHNV